MVDAKLIASFIAISVVVAAALNYVNRETTADSVDYTDDWSKRLKFICDQNEEDGGCFNAMCDAFNAGDITPTTPLLIECSDDTFRTASLDELHSTEDWYARARLPGGNTGDVLAATSEWCENHPDDNDATGYFFTADDVEHISARGCARAVPVFAAAVDAEYSRFVNRAHIKEFQDGFAAFCASGGAFEEGCDSAMMGFNDGDENFTAVCEDGTHANFNFRETVMTLDMMRHDGVSDEVVADFILGHCGHSEGHVRRLGLADWNGGTGAKPAHVDNFDDGDEEMDVPIGDSAETKANSLKGLLLDAQNEKGERSAEIGEEGGRVLWGHGHNPHRHTPHTHQPVCWGCANKCGNSCFGRCGAGCSKWNACGGSGEGAHRACVEHDYECSCGSMTYKSCTALMWQGWASMDRCESGNNFYGDRRQCSGSGGLFGNGAFSFASPKAWFFNKAVREWGRDYGHLGSPNNGNACQRVQMGNNHGAHSYGHGNRHAGVRWSGSFGAVPNILDDSRLGWSDTSRGNRKKESWHRGWLSGW